MGAIHAQKAFLCHREISSSSLHGDLLIQQKERWTKTQHRHRKKAITSEYMTNRVQVSSIWCSRGPELGSQPRLTAHTNSHYGSTSLAQPGGPRKGLAYSGVREVILVAIHDLEFQNVGLLSGIAEFVVSSKLFRWVLSPIQSDL